MDPFLQSPEYRTISELFEIYNYEKATDKDKEDTSEKIIRNFKDYFEQNHTSADTNASIITKVIELHPKGMKNYLKYSKVVDESKNFFNKIEVIQ